MNIEFRIKVVKYVYQKADTHEQAVKRARKKGYISKNEKVESVRKA